MAKKKNIVRKKKDIPKKDSRVIRLILFIILILSIGVLLGSVSYTINKMHQYKEDSKRIISYSVFNSSVEITPGSVGLNGDRDGLKYGKTTAGGGGTRYVDVNTSEDALVQIFISGDMTKFLSVEENNFIMKAGEFRKIPINLEVPNDTSLGFYTGEVHILLLRPLQE
jgi:hypothetical protein